MVFDGEIKHARAAPAMLFKIVSLTATLRHAGIGQVGDARGNRVDFATDALQRYFRRLQFFAKTRHLGHHRRHVFALGFEHADLLAAGIAKVLQFLGANLNLLALGF